MQTEHCHAGVGTVNACVGTVNACLGTVNARAGTVDAITVDAEVQYKLYAWPTSASRAFVC